MNNKNRAVPDRTIDKMPIILLLTQLGIYKCY